MTTTADPDPALVELMASAGYEATRPAGSSRPPWPECTEFWRQAQREEFTAALIAAERAGYRISKP